ncbi:MAG: hypothetical protein PWQ82_1770 [Thermosediminibacterales bacterium]|nr:hypothetical protein [Thermosediminibacterales bacterium]
MDFIRGSKFFAGILALVLAITFTFLTAAAFATDLDDLREKQEQIEQKIKQQKQRLEQVKKQQKTVLTELDQIERELEATKEDLENIQDELIKTEQNLALTEEELEEAQKKADEQFENMKERLKVMYKKGPVDYLDVIMGSKSFTDLVTRIEILKRIIDYDRNLLNELRKSRDLVAEKKASLEEQKAQIIAVKQEISSKKRKIEAKAAARESLLEKLVRNKKAYERALDEQEKALEELNRKIAEIQARQKKGYMGTAKFVWPTPGYTRITSPYGWRIHPILKTKRMHTGIDIAAPMGSKIVAATHGEVIYAGWLSGYGNTVILDHGGGISTMYAHASKLLVRAGQKVKQGDTIAKVGTTGLSTGPHLHFEVRENGKHTNPLKWLK